MKVLLFVLAFAAYAHAATPSVGDWAVRSVHLKDAQGDHFTTKRLAITGYDAATDTFTYTIETTPAGGSATTVTNTAAGKDMFTDAQQKYYLDHCDDIGGAFTYVATAAGHFQSCRYKQKYDDYVGKAWIGRVPFGFLRVETRTDDYYELEEVTAFGSAQP